MSLRARIGSALLVVAFASSAAITAEPTKGKSRRRAPKPAALFTAAAVNDPATRTPIRRGSSGSAVLRAQILLDRARFSPGEIDGVFGSNVVQTVAGYQKAHEMTGSGMVDEATWKLLNSDTATPLARYSIRPEDVAGPFETIPEDMMEKAALPALSYSSPLELLSEKFHVSPKLLTKLNPGMPFDKAGEEILVPNIHAASPAEKAAKVVVDQTSSTVSAFDAEGKRIAQYPATMGSEHDPLPIGDWKITGVSRNPPFHYNPDLFWDADANDEKATIKPGPNNPVGVVWIDLSKPHYGIHGTPEPSTIGKTQSHGCIRLTNWDAAELAAMVTPGTPAILQE
jgi:lipoprotein-anchoring transpeptidase ErfK/SrfK